MKNKTKQTIIVIILLVVLSAIIYGIQLSIFYGSPYYSTLFYFLQDLAFLPIEVAMVTFVFNRFLEKQEKEKQYKKIKVIISTFFVEGGLEIMESLSKCNVNSDEIKKQIDDIKLIKKREKKIRQACKALDYKMEASIERIVDLKKVLLSKKHFLVRMLENDNLLEHDSFTDTLWAVFHVADELQLTDVTMMTEEQINHLCMDLNRAYQGLVDEWITYIVHLEREYPYLYKTAIKRSPFK